MEFSSPKVFVLDFKPIITWKNKLVLKGIIKKFIVLSLKNYWEQDISLLFMSLHFATFCF